MIRLIVAFLFLGTLALSLFSKEKIERLRKTDGVFGVVFSITILLFFLSAFITCVLALYQIYGPTNVYGMLDVSSAVSLFLSIAVVIELFYALCVAKKRAGGDAK